MTTYIFDSMKQSDAANFTSDDLLVFTTGNANTINVTHADPTALTTESITLANATNTLTFSAAQLAAASQNHQLAFADDTGVLALGYNGGDTIDLSTGYGATAGDHARVYAFGGGDDITGSVASDTIDGGAGNDTINGVSGAASGLNTEQDYLFGGTGADTINGSDANEHIYGNTMSAVAGDVDGADLIDAGAGKDYVNGNAGNDTINGGDDSDRLYGGAGNDSIDGGGDNGNDYLQGNKGNDTLNGGDGIDELHGGADNDVLHGDAGNDAVFGDNGNDTVYGDAGYDKLTGGAGNDVFAFGATDAGIGNVTSATTAANHGVTDQILDYVDGSDKIDLAGTYNFVVHGDPAVAVSTVSAAYDYARQLIGDDRAATPGHTDIAAITVGSDTYLFYNTAGTATVDQVIKVAGVADTVFTAGDFI